MTAVWAVWTLAIAAAPAGPLNASPAERPVPTAEAHADAPRNYVNFRGGLSTGGRRPELCLEVAPIELVGVEACGTGSGFLHHDPDPEIAHFRAKLKLHTFETVVGAVQPRLGLGFAELQVGEDAPGFYFTSVGPSGVETSGPEIGASIRTLYPVYGGFELIGELDLSAAYFLYAPSLTRPAPALEPTLTFTLGFGF